VVFLSFKRTQKKRSSAVSINVTEEQRNIFQSLIADWDISMAIVLRRLIQYALRESVNMENLFKQYYCLTLPPKTPAMTKSYKTSIRLGHKECLQFRDLADKWGRTPAAIAEILMDLFNGGVIKKSDIWE
jgi:DNA-binding MarR family transcriptional regulator